MNVDDVHMAFGIKKQLSVPDEATATYTFPFPGKPITVVTRHIGDANPAYKSAHFHASNLPTMLRRQATNRWASEDERDAYWRDDAKIVADTCFVSWDAIEDGSTEVAPCTPDKVFEFLCEVLASVGGLSEYLAFRGYASDLNNYRRTPIVADASALGKK